MGRVGMLAFSILGLLPLCLSLFVVDVDVMMMAGMSKV
jgi:hypothetical protein